MKGGLFASVICLLTTTSAIAADGGPVVAIDAGKVRGATEQGVETWKGIPFAAPPVGALRWRAPQPAMPWKGIRDSTAYGPDCMQEPFAGDAAPLGTKPSEDCLYLNVWRPAGNERKLPVVVWIYGGGFVNGGASPPTYSGAPLARKGVVFVSFNYRVGRFGTFAHPQLTKQDPDRGPLGNYGFLDQIAALNWVRRNVARFGGDPANVTIIGESAGGASVHAMVTSPLAQGLFSRAVIMSGGDGTRLIGESPDLPQAERAGLELARRNGIAPDDPDALRKLRALTAQQVTNGLNLTFLFGSVDLRDYASPFADGRIAVDAGRAYQEGRFPRIPMMIGATDADIGGPTGMMVAGARRVAGEVSDKGAPVWEYRFSYVASSNDAKAAEHATDIPFFLDTQAIKYGAATSARDNAMGRTISRYLVNFARTGDPNGQGLPAWPRYDREQDRLMEFARDGRAVAIKDPLGAEMDAASGRE